MPYKFNLFDTDEHIIGSGPLSIEAFNAVMANAVGQDLEYQVSSCGGDVWTGLHMYDAIKRHEGETMCYIPALAASSATLVALGAKRVVMAKNALFMIHKPAVPSGGDADDLQKGIDTLNTVQTRLANIYMDKTGLDEETINSLINATTWMTADQALSLGFIDAIEEYEHETPVNNLTQMLAYSKTAPAVYQRVINKIQIQSTQEPKTMSKELIDRVEAGLTKVMNFLKGVKKYNAVTNLGTITSFQPLAKGVQVFNEAGDEAAKDGDYEIENEAGKKVKASVKDGVINEMEVEIEEEDSKEEVENLAVMNRHTIVVTNKTEVPAVVNALKKIEVQNALIAEQQNIINALKVENQVTEESIRAKIKSEFTPEGSKRSTGAMVTNTTNVIEAKTAVAQGAAARAVAKAK